MRDDLIEIHRTIGADVLGSRIRSARLRAGLTQAQVAGSTMSVAYVSRIESGHRRPDPSLLEAIAERVAVSVDELLLGVDPDRLTELRVQLDHAQLALATGSAADALARVERLLEDPALGELPELVRAAAYVRAYGLEATGDMESAIIALEDLSETEPRDLTWINGITALSRCYRESGELGRAIDVGVEATRFIEESGLSGLSDAIRLTLTVAAAYFERGDVDHAARLCRRAVDRAEELESPLAQASAYWNASIIESHRGNSAAALPLAERAMLLLETSDSARNVARLRTQLGILELRTERPDPAGALEHLQRAQRELEIAQGSPSDRADNALAQARARFMLGDDGTARQQAADTAAAVRVSAPLVAADALVLLGQIAVANDELDAARAHYREAVLLLTGLGADRAAAQLWFELGAVFEELGEARPALDCYRRAAAATGLVPTALTRSVSRTHR